MKKILFIALFLMCSVGSASAYQLYLSCPETVQVGLPLKCSIDSNFPAGTTFDVVVYQSGYTATSLRRQSVTIQENHATQYQLIDTKGLPGGQYKVEIQFIGPDEGKLSTDSVILQLPRLLDRSNEITITSPMTQTSDEPLRIEGSVTKVGNEGVQIEVTGPDGVIFGPQWIGTKEYIQSGAGEFTQQVSVSKPGDYEVSFRDSKGYIGVKTFKVISPATPVPTTVPTTAPVTTIPSTTVTTVLPTTTQAPLSFLSIITALSLVGMVSVILMKKHG
ncbi:MAG TPA: hypothetical protein VFC43_03485 [Methanoregula sp.]|nr:hypothetical protein [Methanoregula sp.]